MKVCCKCKIELNVSCFSKRSDLKDGLDNTCKLCKKESHKKWYIKNRQKVLEKARVHRIINIEIFRKKNKLYYEKNKEIIGYKKSKYYRKNKEKILEKNRKFGKVYYENNKRKVKNKHKLYYEKNKSKISSRIKKNHRNQYRNNIQFKLKDILRSRLNSALKAKKSRKVGSAVKDLGITIPEFKLYIESMFRDGMTWENHGKVWHLDHIKPLASFDLSNREQFLQAANWKNYQPLLVHENLVKYSKIIS